MPFAYVKSNPDSNEDILIPDIGVSIPSGGQEASFDKPKEIESLLQSSDLEDLVTDDFGNGEPSLTINDGSKQISPEDLEGYLSVGFYRKYPDKTARDSSNDSIVYVGKKEEDGATTSDPKWKIYYVEVPEPSIRYYADGNTKYDNVWDDRESLSYSQV